MTFTRALKYTPFAWLWSGQTLSRVGDFLYEVVLAWWVLEQTGSALQMGMVLVFSLSPMVLFSLIGGVMVDRWPRIPIMILSDCLRGVVVAVVAVMALNQTLQIWHVYLASLIFGLVDSFFQPAYTALVPQLIGEDDLPSANALSSLSAQIGRIAGPALAAGIIALGGTGLGFVVNAGTFFVSTLCLLPLLKRLPRLSTTSSDEQAGRIWAEVKEGISTVLGRPILWISILIFAMTNITLAGPYSVAMPFLVQENFAGNVNMLGLLYALFPIGYVLGGIWMGRKKVIRRRGLTSYLGLALAGLGIAALGLPLPLVVIGLAALLNGAALEVNSLIWTNLLQVVVPAEKLGRVASIDLLGSYLLLPLGFGLTGWATDLLGAATVFIIGGMMTVIMAGVALLHPAIQQFD